MTSLGKEAGALEADRGYQRALELARKLVGLAGEQLDALKRDSRAQYEWLVLRRQEVTDQLPRFVAPGAIPSAEVASALADLRLQLASIDAEMEAIVRARLSQIQEAQAAVRRSVRALSGYRNRRASAAAYLDRKR